MTTENLTKKQAIDAMRQGRKVTHRLFTEAEWVTIQDGLITTEDGYQCSITEFFNVRWSEYWYTGWRIVA
jgi:hypothetical protein